MDFDNNNAFDMNLDALLNELKQEFNASAKKKIVAIDDDREVLKLIKSLLGETYDVTPMANGLMAVNYFKNKSADLILLDYEMPMMSGAEVLKKIRENPDTKNIPVIFLTSVSDNEKVQEIMMLGVNGYILKPINASRIKQDIKRILG